MLLFEDDECGLLFDFWMLIFCCGVCELLLLFLGWMLLGVIGVGGL